MTHAFKDILQRRRQRHVRLARAGYLLKRSSRWLVALAITSLVLILIAGFAEARGGVDSTFDWPWSWFWDETSTGWLDRLTGGGERPIAPLTGAMLVMFVGGWLTMLGIWLLRTILRVGFGPLAIARSVLDEAVRNKTVIVLLALLLMALAAWPYSTTAAPEDVRQPLRYQIQSFLSFSGMSTGVLLGAVTILFSAYTVSQDINVRRTGDVFVKPIGRVTYLLGKWIGVIGLMAMILAVETVIVYGVARFWLGTNLAKDAADAAAVNQHVLVARGEAMPMPPEPFVVTAKKRYDSLVLNQPDLIAMRGPEDTMLDLVAQERNAFMSIPHGESKEYLFVGLQQAKRNADDLEERIRANRDVLAQRLTDALGTYVGPDQISLGFIAPYASLLGVDVQPGLLQWRFAIKGINTYGSAEGYVDIRINGQLLAEPVSYVIDRVQIRDLPATYVNDDGSLILEIINVHPDSLNRERTIQFDTDTWMQVYHVQGDFAPNLIRGAAIHLVRLAFLALLGVVAGALWSFAVAATFSLCIWLLAAGGAWLQQTLTTPAAQTDVMAVDVGFNHALLPIIRFFASFLSRYSSVGVSSHLVDGRYISYQALTSQVFWVGLVWMGIILALGGWLFNRREIARVQV